MTQEHKDLLFKDLCSRLPYQVKLFAKFVDGIDAKESKGCLSLIDDDLVVAFVDENNDNSLTYVALHEVKPYLFPFESMTEKQKEVYCSLQQKVIYNSKGLINSDVMEYVNWCYKNHLDVNGLIPMDLAKDATGLNIY